MDNRDWTVGEARDELRRWKAVHDQRDELIRETYAAGLSKTEIWQLTGVSRSTIDRIIRGY